MNVTSIVSSHCFLVACVVVSCLDFPIVACSAAGSRDEVSACSVHVDVASLARVPASLGCLSASAASAASAVVAALLAG